MDTVSSADADLAVLVVYKLLSQPRRGARVCTAFRSASDLQHTVQQRLSQRKGIVQPGTADPADSVV